MVDYSRESESCFIDLKRCQFSEWKTILFPDGLQASSTAEPLIIFKDKIFICYDGKVYYTEDLEKWNNIPDKNLHLSSRSRFSIANESLFIINNDKVYLYSEVSNIFKKLNIPDEYEDESVSYENVLYNGDSYLIWGRYDQEYTYTKEGIIFDSEETDYYKCTLIAVSADLENFEIATFDDDYFRHITEDILTIDTYFIAMLDDERSDERDRKFIISKDGEYWNDIDAIPQGDIRHPNVFRDQLIFGSGHNSRYDSKSRSIIVWEPYLYNITDESMKPIKSLPEDADLGGLISFNSYNIYVFPNDDKDGFLITNDLKSWSELKLPNGLKFMVKTSWGYCAPDMSVYKSLLATIAERKGEYIILYSKIDKL